MDRKHDIETIRFDGGWLCLDFINTVHSRKTDILEDYLYSYEDFILWGLTSNALDQKDWASLEYLALNQTKKSERIFSQAIAVRENLYKLLSQIARNEIPEEKYINEYNKILSRSLRNLELKFGPSDKAIIAWEEGLEKLLNIVVKSAYDLLISDKLKRVKECGSCGWLFLDQSKNKSRRWCDMQTCGSSDKARRYYRRKKAQAKTK